jgi:hypothetical protein
VRAAHAGLVRHVGDRYPLIFGLQADASHQSLVQFVHGDAQPRRLGLVRHGGVRYGGSFLSGAHVEVLVAIIMALALAWTLSTRSKPPEQRSRKRGRAHGLTPKEIFEQIVAPRVAAPGSFGANTTIQFLVTGEDGGAWFVESVANPDHPNAKYGGGYSARVVEGQTEWPTFTVELGREELVELVEHRWTEAYRSGRIKVSRSEAELRLAGMFPRFRDNE